MEKIENQDNLVEKRLKTENMAHMPVPGMFFAEKILGSVESGLVKVESLIKELESLIDALESVKSGEKELADKFLDRIELTQEGKNSLSPREVSDGKGMHFQGFLTADMQVSGTTSREEMVTILRRTHQLLKLAEEWKDKDPNAVTLIRRASQVINSPSHF